MSKFGFIGCGNMGGALVSATAKVVSAENIYLCDALKAKSEELANKYGANVSCIADIAEKCDYIFLGVKPQGFSALFEELSPILKERKDDFVLVSMAAGISISAVEKMSACDCAIIRIMPNTPVSVGEGMILYSANKTVGAEQIDTFNGREA